MKISQGITFQSGNGGSVVLNTEREDLQICGIEDGYVFFEDIYLNSYNDLMIDIEDQNTRVTIEDESETVVVDFGLTSTVPRGVTDFKFYNLQPGSWYRLYLNGELGKTKSGTTHGKTNKNSMLQFKDVIISNE